MIKVLHADLSQSGDQPFLLDRNQGAYSRGNTEVKTRVRFGLHLDN